MSSFFAFIFYTIGYDTFILVFSHFHSFYFLSYLTFCFFLSSFNFFFPFHTFSFYPSFTHFHLSFQVSFTLPLTSMTLHSLFLLSARSPVRLRICGSWHFFVGRTIVLPLGQHYKNAALLCFGRHNNN